MSGPGIGAHDADGVVALGMAPEVHRRAEAAHRDAGDGAIGVVARRLRAARRLDGDLKGGDVGRVEVHAAVALSTTRLATAPACAGQLRFLTSTTTVALAGHLRTANRAGRSRRRARRRWRRGPAAAAAAGEGERGTDDGVAVDREIGVLGDAHRSGLGARRRAFGPHAWIAVGAHAGSAPRCTAGSGGNVDAAARGQRSKSIAPLTRRRKATLASWRGVY